jgi:outer membrane protein TolC
MLSSTLAGAGVAAARPSTPLRQRLPAWTLWPAQITAAAALALLLAVLVAAPPALAQDDPTARGLPPPPLPAEPAPPPPPAAPPLDQPEPLRDLLMRTLAWDPQVRVAAALLEITQLRRTQAGSRLWPVAGVSAQYGRSQDRETSLFGVNPVDREVDRAEATLRWNLYNAGNDVAELRGSERDIEVARAELRRAREETSERVADAYAELLRLEGLLPHAQLRLDSVQALTQQVQRQTEAGRVAEADLQQAQATLLDAEIVQQQLQSDIQAARERLSALVGGEVRPALPVALPLLPEVPAAPRSGAVAASQARVAAARERVRPEASLLAPRVDLELRQRLSDRTTPQPTTTTERAWVLSARWDLPVGGELQARRLEGVRRAEASEAEADRVLRLVQAELQTLPPRIRNARRAVALLDDQITRYDALLRAGELQFEAGRRTLAQLASLHDGRFVAQQRRAEQAHRLLTGQLRWLALTGELLPALGVPGS